MVGDAVAVASALRDQLAAGVVTTAADQLEGWHVPASRAFVGLVSALAIGFIGGAGSSGGAVAPFTTGILAQAVGTWVLHPVCIGLYVAMIVFWYSLPRASKRRD